MIAAIFLIIPVVISACWLHPCLQGFPATVELGSTSNQTLGDLQHETTNVVDVDIYLFT